MSQSDSDSIIKLELNDSSTIGIVVDGDYFSEYGSYGEHISDDPIYEEEICETEESAQGFYYGKRCEDRIFILILMINFSS